MLYGKDRHRLLYKSFFSFSLSKQSGKICRSHCRFSHQIQILLRSIRANNTKFFLQLRSQATQKWHEEYRKKLTAEIGDIEDGGSTVGKQRHLDRLEQASNLSSSGIILNIHPFLKHQARPSFLLTLCLHGTYIYVGKLVFKIPVYNTLPYIETLARPLLSSSSQCTEL